MRNSSNAYGGLQTENGRNAFARVFRVFLDEKNYPIVFHCIAGQDRTGAVAYILGALLGMSENDLALGFTREDIARFREAMLCGASGQQIGRPHSGDED